MTPYAVRAHDLHHALSEFAPEPTTGATYQSMPLCGFERSTTIQCRGQCRRALRRFHRLRDQSPSLDPVGRNHIFPVTAVRSIAEQIQSLIAYHTCGTVGRLEDHRFYRSFSNTVTENICINV